MPQARKRPFEHMNTATLNVSQSQPPSDHQPDGRARADCVAPQRCFICGHDIVDDAWFCRIPHEHEKTVLCTPRCALRYFEGLHPSVNNDGDHGADYEHRGYFFVGGEEPWG